MQNIRARSINRPKISTMPRNQTEASEQLELYKMVTKRQRMQQELQFMEKRLEQLRQELSVLDNQIENTEKTIQNLRQNTEEKIPTLRQRTPSSTQSATRPKIGSESSNFQTFYLEY